MNWENRTVSEDLRVDKYTVNEIFVNYLKDKFYVNRRYQRKLVWELKEKRLLIDSMLKKIPLPAILIAQYDLKEDNNFTVLEIVDGMQRLNTIISFVLGEFSILYKDKMCYFDPNSYNETFQLMMDGKLIPHESLLPRDICQEFCRYQLPAIITGQNKETIELIFTRINSTGKKISSHDLRQSMATGEFSDLVRRIASDIRLDNTYDDRIRLCEMSQISVGYKKYGYGVDLDTVFWRRHDLINSQNIKESKDEEIIETLLALVLLGKFKKSKDSLDKLYEKDSNQNKLIEDKVSKIGKIVLEESFKKVFDVFDMIFDSVQSDFSSYLFEKKNTKNKDECFKILFLSLYKLIAEGYVITDYLIVAECIKEAKTLFDSFINADKIDYNKFDLTVKNLYKILKPCFSKVIEKQDDEITADIKKRLNYSKIEQQMTEFKIGISDFSSSEINMDCIHRIARTLVAMANTNNGRDKEGFIIIGIANNRESYISWYNEYKEYANISNQHYIPGITCEASKLFHKTTTNNSDEYLKTIRKLLSVEPISNKLKNYVLENLDIIDYYDIELVLIRSKNVGEVSLYDGIKWVRQGNETIKI